MHRQRDSQHLFGKTQLAILSVHMTNVSFLTTLQGNTRINDTLRTTDAGERRERDREEKKYHT